jgi:hypothetical protein
MIEALLMALFLLVGIIIGILVSFTCLRFAMWSPLISPTSVKGESKTQPKRQKQRKWDPRTLLAPGERASESSSGPAPSVQMTYESPSDYLDPVNPDKYRE